MINLEIDNQTGKHSIKASGNMMDICSDFLFGFLTICRQLEKSGTVGKEIAREMRESTAAALQSDDLFEKFKRSDDDDDVCIISVKEAAEV